MNLKKILSVDVIVMDVKAVDKNDIIAELVDILVVAKKVKDRDAVLAAVLKREKQMSTGIQAGIAIPHGKCVGINELYACIAVAKEDKEFGALDGKPSRIFVLTISPAHKTGPHVQFLAEISRLLTKPDVRNSILEANDPSEVLKLFLS